MMAITSNTRATPTPSPIVLGERARPSTPAASPSSRQTGMDEMKYDMGGAASVLGTMHALAQLQLPINVIGVLAGCENMPGATPTAPVTSSLPCPARPSRCSTPTPKAAWCAMPSPAWDRYDPATVIDVATLTGACIIAPGHHTSGLLANHNPWPTSCSAPPNRPAIAPGACPVRRYQEQLESPFADMANIGGRPAERHHRRRLPVALHQKYNWAHLDIAGTAWKSSRRRAPPAVLCPADPVPAPTGPAWRTSKTRGNPIDEGDAKALPCITGEACLFLVSMKNPGSPLPRRGSGATNRCPVTAKQDRPDEPSDLCLMSLPDDADASAVEHLLPTCGPMRLERRPPLSAVRGRARGPASGRGCGSCRPIASCPPVAGEAVGGSRWE